MPTGEMLWTRGSRSCAGAVVLNQQARAAINQGSVRRKGRHWRIDLGYWGRWLMDKEGRRCLKKGDLLISPKRFPMYLCFILMLPASSSEFALLEAAMQRQQLRSERRRVAVFACLLGALMLVPFAILNLPGPNR